MLRKSYITIVAAIAGLLSGGCFTGIESTPRITDKDVIKSGVAVTPEQTLAAKISPSQISSWQPGHRLLATDSRLSMLLDGVETISAGDTLIYTGCNNAITFTGDTTVIVTFNATGRKADYRSGLSPVAFAGAERLSIPFTIDLDMVKLANNELAGRDVYIMTSQRIDAQGLNNSGRKFIPVKITEVTAGSEQYPLTVRFTPENDRQLQATPMTAGNAQGATRNFDRVFSLSDPYLRYPAITPSTWELIRNSQLAEGMTPDECRLSIGAPADVIKRNDGTSYFERWTFENGSYLLFIDGLLSSWRR